MMVLRKRVVRKFKDIGFGYITLDIEGLRSGSMNEVLNPVDMDNSSTSDLNESLEIDETDELLK